MHINQTDNYNSKTSFGMKPGSKEAIGQIEKFKNGLNPEVKQRFENLLTRNDGLYIKNISDTFLDVKGGSFKYQGKHKNAEEVVFTIENGFPMALPDWFNPEAWAMQLIRNNHTK